MEFLAAFAVGVAVAGVVLILGRLVMPGLPRYAAPAAAGVAMIAFTVWSEYTWFSRTEATLPDDVRVVSTFTESSMIRPWTKLAPYVDRFAAVDMASLRRNDAAPGQVMADVIVVARQSRNARLPVLVDCPGGRRADIADGVAFDDAGRVEDADWTLMAADDPLLAALCAPEG
ncbi:MAG: hypothetical protein AAGF90_01560 [Pseudomonadota bacterium]